MRLLEIQGKRYGRLTAITFSRKDKWNKHLWLFRCVCGKEKEILKNSVITGRVHSCGCRQGRYTHGMSRNVRTKKFYLAWSDMKRRCLNPKDKAYRNYGGRDIGFSRRWKKFENFRDDMFLSFKEHEEQFGGYQTTIERCDNEKGYSVSNCKWATMKEQQNNKRTNILAKL